MTLSIMHLYIRSNKVYTEVSGITLKHGYIPAVAEQWPPPSSEDTLPIEPALWFKVLVMDSISIDCVRQAVMWNTDDAFSLRRSLNESGEFDLPSSKDRRKRISESMYYGGSECIAFEANMENLYVDTEKVLSEYASGTVSREKFDERIMQILHTMVLPRIKLTSDDVPKIQEAYSYQERMVTRCDDEVLQKQDQIEKIQKTMSKQRQTFIQELAIHSSATKKYQLNFAQLVMTHLEEDIKSSSEELENRQEAVEHAKETYNIMPDEEVEQHIIDKRRKRDSWFDKHQKLIFAREHLRDIISNLSVRKKSRSSLKHQPTPLQNMYVALELKILEIQDDLCGVIEKKVLVISVKEAIKETLEELRVSSESLGVDVGVLGSRRPTDVLATSKVPKDWQTLAEQVADMVCERKGRVAKMHAQFTSIVIERCQAALFENSLLETSDTLAVPRSSRHSNSSRFYNSEFEDSLSIAKTVADDGNSVRLSELSEKKKKKRSGIYLENKLYLLQHQQPALGNESVSQASDFRSVSQSVEDLGGGQSCLDAVRVSQLSNSSKSSSLSTSSKKSHASSTGLLSGKSSNSGSQQSVVSSSSGQSKSSKSSSQSSLPSNAKNSDESSLLESVESGLTDFTLLESYQSDHGDVTNLTEVVMRRKPRLDSKPQSSISVRSSFENSSDISGPIDACLPFRMSRFQYETLPYMDTQQFERESRALVELEGSTDEPDMIIVHNTDKDYLKTTIDSLRIEVRDHFDKVCNQIQRKLKCYSDSSFKNIWLCYEPHFYESTTEALVALYEVAYSHICGSLKDSVPHFMAADLDLQDSIIATMLEDKLDDMCEAQSETSVDMPIETAQIDIDKTNVPQDLSEGQEELHPQLADVNADNSQCDMAAEDNSLGDSSENLAQARANTPRDSVLKDSGIYDEDITDLGNLVEHLSPELLKFVENNAFPSVKVPDTEQKVPEVMHMRNVNLHENQETDSHLRSPTQVTPTPSPGEHSLQSGPSSPKEKLQKVHIHQAGDKSPVTVLLSRRTWPVLGEIPTGVEYGVEALSLQPEEKELPPARKFSPLPNKDKPSLWSQQKTLKLKPEYLKRFEGSMSCVKDAIHSSVPLVKLQQLTRCLREINQQIQTFQEEFKMKESGSLGICADDLIDILVILLCNCDPVDTARLYPHLMLLTDLLPPFFEGGPFSFSLVQFSVAFQFIQERLILQSRQHSWSLDALNC